MTGYVRPLRGELKVRQFEQFKAVYCGLCHTLAARFGPFARYMLSYDLTFLALALTAAEGGASYEKKRCPASPFRKKCVLCRNRPLEKSADICVILSWWKLYDRYADGNLLQKALYGLLCVAAKPYYRKAARARPEYEAAVRKRLADLRILEKERAQSLDRPADVFARCVGDAAETDAPEKTGRPLYQIFYHVGRWIYIMDAYDDVREDLRKGRYNPVVSRFGLKDAGIPAGVRDHVALTAGHSLNLACDAYELAGFGDSGEIIANILYLGLPFVQKKVLEGTWRKGEKHERSL